MRYLQKISVALLATIVKVAAHVYRLLRASGHVVGAALKLCGRGLLKITVPLFGLILSAKRLVLKLYAPVEQRNRLLHLFTRRYFFHLTFAGLALAVVTSNLNANEIKRDELTYSNVFTNLAQGDQYGDLVEVQPSTPQAKRYVGSTALGPETAVNDAAAAAEMMPGTIGSGSVVVKPIRLPSGAGTAQEHAAAARASVITYTVEEGDTISGLAVRFGVTINTILWENNLTAYSIIRPGQRLTILPTSGVRHKVARGETISKIAAKYGVDTATILAVNRLASAEDLQIGELLMVPNGKKPQPAPIYTLRRNFAIAPLSSGARLGWPASCQRITQYFGWRHTGIDIACPAGTPVYAAAAGRVIKAQGGWNGGYGIMIVLQHPDGTQTLYGHNSKLYVSVGDEVVRGQAIAGIGSTGRSSGPHVHFEIRVGGYRRNPLSYLR